MKTYKILIYTLLLGSTLPFFWLFSTLDFSLRETDPEAFNSLLIGLVGNVTGLIGAMLFIWQFLLGSRSLVSLITDDLVWVNKIHSKLGKYGSIFVLAHPFLQMISYLETLLWIIIPSNFGETELHITYGRVAWIIFLAIFVLSAFLRGRIKYRPWLQIHHLSYVLMAFVFLHALDIGTYLNRYNFLKAMWFTWIVLFGVLVIFRLLFFAGLFKLKYKIVEKRIISGNILFLRVRPIGNSIKPNHGQYAYIQPRRFGEVHPFSIMDYAANGDLFFALKTVGKGTKKLSELPLGHELFLDGPYGIFTREKDYTGKPKLILAGGIGITPFIQFIRQKGDSQTYLFNSNRYLEEAFLDQQLNNLMPGRYTNYVSDQVGVAGEHVQNRQFNSNDILTVIGNIERINEFEYFICGSPNFVKGVRQILKSLNIQNKNIHLEEFSL